MADEKATEATETTTKEKRTVPALMRTARGVADHAAAVLEMQWDKERKSFKDPVTSMMALFTYAKLTAALLDEAEQKYNARSTAAEVRIEKLEAQIAAFEAWRTDVTKQSEEMARGMEEMMQGGPEAVIAKLREKLDENNAPAVLPPPLTPPAPLPEIIDTSVVQLKQPEKADKKREKREEKNGGAA